MKQGNTQRSEDGRPMSNSEYSRSSYGRWVHLHKGWVDIGVSRQFSDINIGIGLGSMRIRVYIDFIQRTRDALSPRGDEIIRQRKCGITAQFVWLGRKFTEHVLGNETLWKSGGEDE